MSGPTLGQVKVVKADSKVRTKFIYRYFSTLQADRMVLQTRDRDSTEAYVQALARYLDDDEAIYRLHSQLRKRSLFSVISKRDMSAAMIWKQELDQVNSKISGILTQFEEEKSHEWAIHHLLVFPLLASRDDIKRRSKHLVIRVKWFQGSNQVYSSSVVWDHKAIGRLGSRLQSGSLVPEIPKEGEPIRMT